MREQEAAARGGAAFRRVITRRQRDTERDAAERAEYRVAGGEWCQRGVHGVHRVTQPRQLAKAEAIASRVRHREAASRDDDGIGVDWRRAVALDAPPSVMRR